MRQLAAEGRAARQKRDDGEACGLGREPVNAVPGRHCGRGLTNCMGLALAACGLCGRGLPIVVGSPARIEVSDGGG
jgi:hypothetical protein